MEQPLVDFRWSLAGLLRWRPQPLRFDDETEARFERARYPVRLQNFAVSGAIALVILNLFLLADQRLAPDVYEMAFQIRVFLITPIGLMLVILAVLFRDFVLRYPAWCVELVMTLVGAGSALSMGWLLAHSSSPYATLYTAGLLPILIYGNLVQRVRFPYAVVFSGLVVLTSGAGVFSPSASVSEFSVFELPLTLLVVIIAVFTLTMNYRLELEERRRYLWCERTKALRQDLAASQLQLDELSRSDLLTGVPNRRHFDGYVRGAWEAMHQEAGCLALLLIDVDHFKSFNDRYGHPAGDQCLRHVAQALQQRVSTSVGCVARWGGEEFMVALPRMEVAAAMTLAQTLCDSVAALGLRHEASSTAPRVTISVGVAVAQPAQLCDTIEGLIAKADAALYRAKGEGRNRCVQSVTVPGWTGAGH